MKTQIIRSLLRRATTSFLIGLGYRFFSAGRWGPASYLYRWSTHLDPTHRTAWFVLGHSLREMNQPHAAINAYERARQLPPFDGKADWFLFDLHFLLGNYRSAWHHQAGLEKRVISDSQKDLDSSKLPIISGTLADGSILVDVGDLLFYILKNPTLTGIQRVQLSFIESLLRREDLSTQRIEFVIPVTPKGCFNVISRTTLESALSAPDRHSQIDRAFECLAFSQRIEQTRDAVLLSLGIPQSRDYFGLVRQARRHWGWRFAAFVHDCIPLTDPDYFTAAHVRNFESYIRSLTAEADQLFVSTSETREDLFNARLADGDIKIVPLAAFEEHGDASAELATLRRRYPVLDRPFVLFVSTLEKRKNHALALRCWSRLVQEHGADSVPTLVLAGKMGWLVDELTGEIEHLTTLGIPILHLAGLTDREIAVLYRTCMFSIYPSFKEGWGLPISESLAAGRPVLASGTVAMMEVGGSFADYADPHSLQDFYTAVERLVFDDEYRRLRERHIREGYRNRSWDEFCIDIINGIARLHKSS